MNTPRAGQLAVGLACFLTLVGCSTTGKPLAGIGAKGPAAAHSEERSLREEVEKDPFPRAQGLLSASQPVSSRATQ